MKPIAHSGLTSIIIVLLLSISLHAAEFYVAPTGKDTNPGTLDQPFASITRGQQAASPGDTVWLRGGVYEFSGTEIEIAALFDKSGAEGKRINYWAYENEVPVFDFFKLATRVRMRGFSIRGNWLHFRGIELRGMQQILTNVNESWCVRVEGDASNNILERLNIHHNEGPGIFLADNASHILVVNCDSHHNWDPDRGGGNGDGFGGHSTGEGNVFRSNRAWCNSDDGYDLINCRGATTIEYCWSWSNGFVPGTLQPAGNGAGFKSGGFGLNRGNFPANLPRHVIRFNVAFYNRAQGFYSNHHPGGLNFFNNTAFNNPLNFDMLADTGTAKHVLHNNIAYGTGGTIGRQTQADIDDSFNSWTLNIPITDADFVATLPTGADGPRQADGSLPRVNFFKLKPGSKLIDAGKDLGLPFNGKAPDLGAFEN